MIAEPLEAEAEAVAGSGSAAIVPDTMKEVRAIVRDSRRIILIPSGLSIGLERGVPVGLVSDSYVQFM